MHTPRRRERGAEVLFDRRYAMTLEIALAIPSGNLGVPKGILRALTARCDVGPEHSTKIWE